MASQRASFIAVLALAVCTGCGATLPSSDTSSGAGGQPTKALDDVSIYSPASAKLRLLAARFVRAVAEYDTRSETRPDFLSRLDELATPTEQERLSHSPRNHLRWQVLRQRAQHTHLTVTGVSESQGQGADRLLVVESVTTTATTFARVRSFEEYWLSPVLTPAGWRIDRATGPGL